MLVAGLGQTQISETTLRKKAEKMAKANIEEDKLQDAVNDVVEDFKVIQLNINSVMKNERQKWDESHSTGVPPNQHNTEGSNTIPEKSEFEKEMLKFMSEYRNDKATREATSKREAIYQKILASGAKKDHANIINSLLDLQGIASDSDVEKVVAQTMGAYNLHFAAREGANPPNTAEGAQAAKDFEKMLLEAKGETK